LSGEQAWAVTVCVGTRLVHDGELYTVTGMDAGSVLLRGSAGRSLRVHAATLLADPSTRIAGGGQEPPPAAGPLLDDLTGTELEQLAGRLGHVRELLTGYASGSAGTAAEGEPRPQYDPSLPVRDREGAKAAELGVSARTVRRWVAAFRQSGPAGLVDGRSVRPADVLAGVDERWLAMCKVVLGEHVEASRPTRNLVLRRVAARLDAEYGPGQVKEPGIKKARAVLAEITRGTSAFTGSTKGKRSIAGRPAGIYGRLRATRPGEYVLLDTTPLDVFAMEPLTLRWVGVELTVAMDLYSRCITGLRLSPVSTKAVDAAVVLFETLRPAPGGDRWGPAAVCRAAGRRDCRRRLRPVRAHSGEPPGRTRQRGRGDGRGGPRQDLPVRAPDGRVRAAGHLGAASPPADAHRQGRDRKILPHPQGRAAGGAARLQRPGRLQPRR
jgi:hypothetical protein